MRIDSSNARLSTGINTNRTNEESKDKNKSVLKIGGQRAKKTEERLKLISNLEKIRDEYKAEKEKIMGMKISADEKKAKIKDMTDKINEVQGQIQEIKTQMEQEKIEEEKKKVEEKRVEAEKINKGNGDIKKDGVIISRSLYDLIKSHSSIKDIHNLKIIKARQQVEANYLSRSMGEKSYDSKRLEQIAVSNTRIDGAINRKIKALVDLGNKNAADNKETKSNEDDSDANGTKAVVGKYAENSTNKELKKTSGEKKTEE
jgi:hypothetical protein